MTTPSHTELAAQRAAFEREYEAYCQPAEADWFRREDDDPDEYYHVTTKEAWWGWQASWKATAAALESPERVQGEAMRDALESIRAHCKVQPSALAAAIVATCDSALAAAPPTAPAQYSLPDELYESKDWKAANYAGRVEWLHAMYEAKKKELESFLSMAASPTAAAQDVHGQRNAQTLVDIGNAALRAGWNGVDMKAFVLARLATPSPQAEKQPLSEEQIVRCLQQASCIGTVKMSFESGPYDIDRPSINASRLVSAIEAAHGIVTKETNT